MSSHHFVKEEQEPALIVNKLSCLDDEILGQLLEWSPFVMVFEEEMESFQSKGYKLDAVLFQSEEKTLQQDSVEGILYEKGKGISKALQFLKNRNQTAINIITSEDRIGEILQELSDSDLNIVVITETSRYVIFYGTSFSKWLKNGSNLSLTPLGNSCIISTSGFAKNLNKKVIGEKVALSTDTEGLITLEIDQPPVLISEPINF